MEYFKTKEEKEKERAEAEEIIRMAKEYSSKVDKIVRFPGSISEYERFKGYEVEIIDTQTTDKGVTIEYPGRLMVSNNTEMGVELLDKGIEAIVNAAQQEVHSGRLQIVTYYGIPVRKKI